VPQQDVASSAALALGALVASHPQAKRDLTSAGGVLRLVELLLRTLSGRIDIDFAASVVDAILDASTPSCLQLVTAHRLQHAPTPGRLLGATWPLSRGWHRGREPRLSGGVPCLAQSWLVRCRPNVQGCHAGTSPYTPPPPPHNHPAKHASWRQHARTACQIKLRCEWSAVAGRNNQIDSLHKQAACRRAWAHD
jgi:hypothetical protein